MVTKEFSPIDSKIDLKLRGVDVGRGIPVLSRNVGASQHYLKGPIQIPCLGAPAPLQDAITENQYLTSHQITPAF
jgi:hypothetical protein